MSPDDTVICHHCHRLVSRRLEFMLLDYEYYLQIIAKYPRFKRELSFLLVPRLGTLTPK